MGWFNSPNYFLELANLQRQPSGCRIEARLDAWRSEVIEIDDAKGAASKERRDESRRRRHECPRHANFMVASPRPFVSANMI
jgi:hypothetical protein